MQAAGIASTLMIRPVRPDEHAAVGELLVRVYDSLRPGGVAGYAEELRNVAHRADQAEVLVAVDPAGRLLGSVTQVADGGPYAELAGPDEAEFRMLVVDPDAQRTGVGRALVQHCLADARARGRVRVVLSSGEWMTGAHRLYESLGFRRTPERDWEPRPGIRLLTYASDL